MKRQYFGTDGVRGPYGGPVLNDRFARRLGVAAGRWLAEQGVVSPWVIIGRDTRASGLALEKALADGLRSTGVVAKSAGVVPTPAVSLAVRHLGASLGVVVTASHNPASDNGIKFFGPSGVKLDDAVESRLEELLPDEGEREPDGSGGNNQLETVGAEELYVATLTRMFEPGALRGWRIVVDTANGASYRTTPTVLRQLGAEVEVIADAPDGTNINAGCGSQHPETMRSRVVETKARLGVAHDGDADRLILADETGAEVDGDEILAVLAAEALRSGRLQNNTLVATLQSNLGLKRFIESEGGRLVQTDVGDRYVVAAMMAGGYNLGGESSGHIICTDVSPCGDGLAAALLVLRSMIETGKPLSELRRRLVKFPQRTRALRVPSKPPIEDLPGLSSAIAEAERQLADDGRVFVRYSGTEPKLRLLVEGVDPGVVADVISKLEAAVRRELPEP